jgi:histidinol-phosphate aminotransferase
MTPRATPHIAALAPYALADLSVPPGRRVISLAQNESLRSPSPMALEAARAACADAALYPDPDWTDLRAAIADVHSVDPAAILCGAGSMELIGALTRAFLAPGDRALTTAHAYAFFCTATRLAGGEVAVAPETDLTVDVDALLAAAGPETRLVFVANPGNPTGTRIDRAGLLRLRDGLPEGALLVIDEAYGEFADAPGESVFDLVERGDTVVLRTFSKAYGLAGMRVGWGLFPEPVAAEVRKVLNPNNVSAAAQAAAAAAMRDQAYMRETVALTAAIRDRFAAQAQAAGLRIGGAHANFTLVLLPTAPRAARADVALRGAGVLLRGMGGYGLPEALRVTTGAMADMDLAADILACEMEQAG